MKTKYWCSYILIETLDADISNHLSIDKLQHEREQCFWMEIFFKIFKHIVWTYSINHHIIKYCWYFANEIATSEPILLSIKLKQPNEYFLHVSVKAFDSSPVQFVKTQRVISVA